MKGLPSIYKNKDFLLLWAGQLVSQLGTQISTIALMWWVIDKTGSAKAMGIMMLFSTFPSVILSPFAGTFADRINRKALIISMDVFCGILLLLTGYLSYFKILNIWHVNIIVCLKQIAQAFFTPAINASIPNIVKKDEIVKANSMNQGALNLSIILGPALGGILIALFGAAWVFIADGLSYLISALAAAFVYIPKIKREINGKTSFFFDVKDGFNFVKSNSTLFGILLLAAALNFFAGPIDVGIPVLANKILKVGAAGLGYLFTAWGVGAVLITLYLSVFKISLKRYLQVMFGLVISGGCFLMMGMLVNFKALLLVFGLSGFVVALINIHINSFLQESTPDEMRGRVFGFVTMLCGALMPISMGLSGWAIEGAGFSTVFIVMGIAIIAGGIIFLKIPRIKEI